MQKLDTRTGCGCAGFIESADKLTKEVTDDQEVNFNERFRGKEDTAKELQNHAAKKKKTQDTWVDAVENEEVAKIKRAVLRKMTRSCTARSSTPKRATSGVASQDQRESCEDANEELNKRLNEDET